MKPRSRVPQCEAVFKTPDSHYWQCQRRPHDAGKHCFGLVLWEGTANDKTRSCGSDYCPGGRAGGQALKASDFGTYSLDGVVEKA